MFGNSNIHGQQHFVHVVKTQKNVILNFSFLIANYFSSIALFIQVVLRSFVRVALNVNYTNVLVKVCGHAVVLVVVLL